MTQFTKGDRVMTDIGHPGTVISIRLDSDGGPLITVYLDGPSATPDGMYLARPLELKHIKEEAT